MVAYFCGTINIFIIFIFLLVANFLYPTSFVIFRALVLLLRSGHTPFFLS